MDLSIITTLLAQTADGNVAAAAGGAGLATFGKGVALGLAVLGAGIAIGKLSASALEGAARQPEMHGKLQTMMILAIAFIEALALIALLFGTFLI